MSIENRVWSIEHRVLSRVVRVSRGENKELIARLTADKKTSLHLLILRNFPQFTVHSFTFNSRWHRSSNRDGRGCLLIVCKYILMLYLSSTHRKKVVGMNKINYHLCVSQFKTVIHSTADSRLNRKFTILI